MSHRIKYPLLTGVPFALLILLAYYGAAWADTPLGDAPVTETGLAAWWQSGALAGPIALLAALVLVGLERLSCTRWPGLAWLRRGRVRAGLSLSTGAVIGLLPAAVAGSVTWGGLSVALLAGVMAMRPGGGERRDDEAEGAPT